MPFWTDYKDGDAVADARDPKRAYKFHLQFSNLGGTVWFCKKVSKPSFTVSETPHKFLNHTFYYPGKVEWNTVSLTLVDPVSPDIATSFANVIANSGYNVPASEDANGFTTISKGKSVSSLGDVVITQIDSDAEPIETWILNGAWIKDMKFGDLDYDSEDFTLIEIELRYDFATLKGTSGAGASYYANEASTVKSTVWDPGQAPSGEQ